MLVCIVFASNTAVTSADTLESNREYGPREQEPSGPQRVAQASRSLLALPSVLGHLHKRSAAIASAATPDSTGNANKEGMAYGTRGEAYKSNGVLRLLSQSHSSVYKSCKASTVRHASFDYVKLVFARTPRDISPSLTLTGLILFYLSPAA
jgi:hypothetical protein